MNSSKIKGGIIASFNSEYVSVKVREKHIVRMLPENLIWEIKERR